MSSDYFSTDFSGPESLVKPNEFSPPHSDTIVASDLPRKVTRSQGDKKKQLLGGWAPRTDVSV